MRTMFLILLLVLQLQAETSELGILHLISGATICAASVACAIYVPEICKRHGEYALGSFLFYTSFYTFVYGGYEIKVGAGLILEAND